MNKVIILNLGQGNLEDGFPKITATLYQVGENPRLNRQSKLPANPKLYRLFLDWLLLYTIYASSFRILWIKTTEATGNKLFLYKIYFNLSRKMRMEIAEATVERYSEQDLLILAEQIKDVFNTWLRNLEFVENIVLPIRDQLTYNDEIQVIISTDDPISRQFPWHLWKFFEEYPKAEMSLSSPEYQVSNQAATSVGKVRILAILGNSKGIDLTKDKKYLEGLSGVEIQFLPDPAQKDCQVNRQILDEYLRDKKGWDILFFAGHSQTINDRGILAINEYEELAIEHLKLALKNAIANGLKLAIFNSCDGLDLAKQLEKLSIPQVIVMRYPIPDAIAHQFLKHFLVAFSGHKSLSASVREARERLQGVEDRYPCASWLPVLFQNPAFTPSTWKTLIGERVSFRQILQPLLLASLVCTGLVLGVRSLGFLQPVELKAYDYLVRLQPSQSTDERILLITITEDDVNNQPVKERNQASLSDQMLEKVLNKLAQSDVVAIGLDLYREISVQKEYPVLAKRMRESERFFAICPYGTTGQSIWN